MSYSDKYDLEFLDYSQAGWEGIVTTDLEILDDVIQTRAIITLARDTEAYKALGITASGTYEKIISVSGTTDDMICIAIEEGTAGNDIRGQLAGFIENALWSWTIAGDIYLSDSVSGTLTQTPPAVDPQRIGIASSATSMFITAQDGATGATGATGETGATGATGAGGGVTTLSGLSDTPDVYDDGKYLRSTASGTEWEATSGNHSDLSQLDYASAGHTGFASAEDLTNVSGTADTNASDISTLDTKIDTTSGTLQTEIDGKDNYGSWSFAVDGVTKDAITSSDVLDFVGGDNITVTRSAEDEITISGSEGVTNHSELNELDYASAGHTGFASTEALTTTSGVLDDKIIATQNAAATTYYMHEDNSDISGYELLRSTPSDHAEFHHEVTINSGDGETLIDPYITASGEPNTTSIPPGTYVWVLWADVNATSQGPHYLRAKWYRREQDGTEHYLFTQEQEITSTSPTRYFVETSCSGVNMDVTDRLVTKIYAQIGGGSDRTIGYYVEGVERASRFNTPVLTSLITDHGDLTGLADDDHTQYHNDARGDARYYTETELDNGQLDNRYYTETEADVITDKNAWDIANVSGTVDTNTSDLSTLQSDFTTHSGTANIHTVLNDTISGTENLWSADKIVDFLEEHEDTETGKVGKHTLASGVTTGTISFSAPFDNISYNTITTLTNLIDDIVSLYGVIVTDTTVSGFSFELTGETDSSNYVLNWYAADTIGRVIRGTDSNDYGTILAADGEYFGDVMTLTVDDAASIKGSILAQAADFHYDRADADSFSTAPGFCIALEAGAGTKKVLLKGQICLTAWNWSYGKVYLSETAGGLTQTKPSDTGDQIQVLGWALSADTIFFDPVTMVAEVA